MQQIQREHEAKQIITEHEMVMIYFTGNKCSACEAIKEKVEKMLIKYPKIISREINGEVYVDLAAQWQVLTLPYMMLFVEGKETIHAGRHIDLRELEHKIGRYYEMIGLG